MKTKTRITTDGLTHHRNGALVRIPRPAPCLKVKTHIKAGIRVDY